MVQSRTNNNGSYQSDIKSRIDWLERMSFADENAHDNVLALHEPEDDEDDEPILDISDEPIFDEEDNDEEDDETEEF